MTSSSLPSFVLDTSVAFRWFVDQVGFEHAREILDEFKQNKLALYAPDMSRVELGHILRTRGYMKGLLSRDEVLDAVRILDDIGVVVMPTDADHLEQAAALAVDHMISFFDAIFVIHAVERGLPMLTGDGRLARAIAGRVPMTVLRGI